MTEYTHVSNSNHWAIITAAITIGLAIIGGAVIMSPALDLSACVADKHAIGGTIDHEDAEYLNHFYAIECRKGF